MLLRANGRATSRWLDIVNTDIDYRNFCFNYNMEAEEEAAEQESGAPQGPAKVCARLSRWLP